MRGGVIFRRKSIEHAGIPFLKIKTPNYFQEDLPGIEKKATFLFEDSLIHGFVNPVITRTGGAQYRGCSRPPRLACRQANQSTSCCQNAEIQDLTQSPALAMRHDGIYAITMIPLVIDTNVFVAGLRSARGASREVLRRALMGRYEPLFGNALWLEYRDLLDRPVWGDATSATERLEVLAALAQRGRWVTIYYGWRPNLPDEADNHLIELALAGNAEAIVMQNVRDVGRGELHLGSLRILTPAQCLEEWP
ncbi:putative toxin-antitoxin system toxin component, PIN family [Desulfonatronum sp. SC1]|uniref:PIN domain-containing protein n=1 Tax=Desulfonatronum sp. SC1 TaxID=2109626 RepID=UPI0018EE8D3E|nr:PIN domain-containing protein [Desulfonatronum sp. SC1]